MTGWFTLSAVCPCGARVDTDVMVRVFPRDGVVGLLDAVLTRSGHGTAHLSPDVDRPAGPDQVEE